MSIGCLGLVGCFGSNISSAWVQQGEVGSGTEARPRTRDARDIPFGFIREATKQFLVIVARGLFLCYLAGSGF